MPIYTYEREDSELIEREFSIHDFPQEIVCEDGQKAHKVIVSANVLARGWATGLESRAMGVHPAQLPEAREFCAERGLHVDWNARGNPVFHSRAQRKAFMHARNEAAGGKVCVDFDGGYGDET